MQAEILDRSASRKGNPMIDGISFKHNGAEYIVPPLNLGQVKRLLPMIDKMQTEPNPIEKLTSSVSVIHAALSRNYPEMKIEEVEEIVDLGNLKSYLDAVMGGSGLLQGEARAGNVQSGT